MAGVSTERSGSADPTTPIRDRLLVAATEVLRVHGPAELKARVIAEAVGASTISIYHHFGGLPELVSAVVAEGFTDLTTRFVATRELADDPSAELFAMALSTREMAQTNAHLYDLMFGLSTRGTYRALTTEIDSPSARFEAGYAMLVAACQRLVDTGRLHPISADEVAAELWSAVHGFVTLEAAGHFAMHPDPLSTIMRPLAIRILVGMGDDPDVAEAGAVTAVDWWLARTPDTPR